MQQPSLFLIQVWCWNGRLPRLPLATCFSLFLCPAVPYRGLEIDGWEGQQLLHQVRVAHACCSNPKSFLYCRHDGLPCWPRILFPSPESELQIRAWIDFEFKTQRTGCRKFQNVQGGMLYVVLFFEKFLVDNEILKLSSKTFAAIHCLPRTI